ncbi:MAG: B12-binding domain-containing radical SAM protein [Anaerolineae bacterium]
MSKDKAPERNPNRGARTRQVLPPPDFPNTDDLLREEMNKRPPGSVDLLLVNPPAPDGGIWIRSQHRVGRRSREGMIWPQVSLAQMAALFPDLRVEVVDAIPGHMTWEAFEQLLDDKRPRYYVTQVTAPTLENDMYGVFLAKARGAVTTAFGTHVTPMPRTTMEAYPALDYVLRGEPELTLRELVDTLERRSEGERQETKVKSQESRVKSQATSGEGQRLNDEDSEAEVGEGNLAAAWWPNVEPVFAQRLHRLFTKTDPNWTPPWFNEQPMPDPSRFTSHASSPHSSLVTRYLSSIKGLVWRNGADITINPARPFIADLDDLPLPRHELLPFDQYRAPLVGGPYTFIVPSRGCPGACRFCIKHVSYGRSVRFRSPENVLDEIELLVGLGVRKIHMYADLFTVNRDHVMGICRGIVERGLDVRWTCNSRVDFVDPEMLQAMHDAGCWMISWGIESADEEMLKRMNKGITPEQVELALAWSKEAGIMNWGYFIIGLPGETEASIRKTIDFSKRLPLDLVLFHIAAPHPGTPFFFEVVENGWFRPGTRWEEVDMDRSTVLDYPNLKAEDLERWARRAFREWAFRPGPMLTYLRLLLTDPGLIRSAVRIGLETLGWK